MLAKIRRIALELLPPILSRLISRMVMRFRPVLREPDSVTVISTPEEIDEWLKRADAAIQISDDTLREVLASFRYQIATELPSDAFSPEYATAQWEIYKQISGRSDYMVATCELSVFDLESMVRCPFPYSTMSSQTVGDQLVMQGLIIKRSNLHPHSEVLEFGSGPGNLALQLTQIGHQVTAVDISPDYIEVIRRRAQQLGLTVTLACDDMLTFESDKVYDAVIFFESFHHCADHQALLHRLHSLVKSDGIVVFGFEPITPTSHLWGSYPWGVRLDGMSVWSTRRFGWLELGFTDQYFLDVLDRSGWRGQILRFHPVQQGTMVIAHKR